MSMDTAPRPTLPPSPPRPERSGRFLLLGVGIGVVLAIGLAFVLAIAVAATFLVVRSSDSSDAGAPDVVVEPAEPLAAPDVVARFVADWTSGDWAAMGEYADEAVVETARSAHVDGLVVEIVGSVSDQGGELLVADPAGGRASVFVFTLGADADLVVRLDGLSFGGDAG